MFSPYDNGLFFFLPRRVKFNKTIPFKSPVLGVMCRFSVGYFKYFSANVAMLLLLVLQLSFSFTTRTATERLKNDSRRQVTTEKIKNITYPSPLPYRRDIDSRTFKSLLLQEQLSNVRKYSSAILSTGVSFSTINLSCSVCPSTSLSLKSLPWSRARQKKSGFDVFYKIRGWLILCVILSGLSFLVITHYLTKWRVRPRYNACCRIYC